MAITAWAAKFFNRAICFSVNAFAQDAALPKVGNKPLVQVKPRAPMGCKLIGAVKGTKLWAGDCVGSELRGAAPAEDLTQKAREEARKAEEAKKRLEKSTTLSPGSRAG